MADNSVFEKAHSFVLKWEGGLCEDKDDAGGITKYGVSLRFLRSIKPYATRDDIISLTKEQGKELFHKHFWDACKCDELPDKLAFVLYDTAVNTGVSQAIKFLQRSIGVTPVDGKIGKNTLSVAKSVGGCPDIIENFLMQRENFYNALIDRKPSQVVFFKGWMNRLDDLQKAVKDV